MNDLLARIGGHMAGGRRALVSHHALDLSAKDLLIELEGGFAVTVEKQIGIGLHTMNLLVIYESTNFPVALLLLHGAGSYHSMTLPLRKARVFVNFRFSFCLMPSNIVLPWPRTTGLSAIWYSSINPSCANCATMLPLPKITMSGPDSFFILRISAAMSLLTSFVLLHGALSSVLENTTFGIRFMPSPTAGLLLFSSGLGPMPPTSS